MSDMMVEGAPQEEATLQENGSEEYQLLEEELWARVLFFSFCSFVAYFCNRALSDLFYYVLWDLFI